MVLIKPLFTPWDLESPEPQPGSASPPPDQPPPDQPLAVAEEPELDIVDPAATKPSAQDGKPQLSPLNT